MFLSIDFESEVPIYLQLKRQLIQGIAKGELKKGENLPSVRQMAEDIGINLHTVNKAYNMLKADGVINIDRRKGAVVSGALSIASEEYITSLEEELSFMVAEAYCKGLKKQEFTAICEKIYDGYPLDGGTKNV